MRRSSKSLKRSRRNRVIRRRNRKTRMRRRNRKGIIREVQEYIKEKPGQYTLQTMVAKGKCRLSNVACLLIKTFLVCQRVSILLMPFGS